MSEQEREGRYTPRPGEEADVAGHGRNTPSPGEEADVEGHMPWKRGGRGEGEPPAGAGERSEDEETSMTPEGDDPGAREGYRGP